MKKRTALTMLAFIIAIACAVIAYHVSHVSHDEEYSHFAMGGEVTVVGKGQTEDRWYIVTEQGPQLDTGEYACFAQTCTEEQYRFVDIGDNINCDREHSLVLDYNKPMTVIDKSETPHGWYLIVSGELGIAVDDRDFTYFAIDCTQEEYDSIMVGGSINCEAYELKGGMVRSINRINGDS